MKIEIQVNEILFDIKNKSFIEAGTNPDKEAGYNTTAGSENDEELLRLITTASTRLEVVMDKFLVSKSYCDDSVKDEIVLTAGGTIDFFIAESVRRRRVGLKALAQMMHDFIVSTTLYLWYEGVKMGDMAKLKSDEAANSADMIRSTLYTKRRPVRTQILNDEQD